MREWPAEGTDPPLSPKHLASFKNQSIPSSEALTARTWLYDAEKDLTHINEASRILDSHRSALLPLIDIYRVALAPHKTLPVEIIRKIFILSADCWGRPNLNRNVVPRRSLGVHLDIRLILSRVCSHWRTVTLATQELWNDIRVDFKDGDITRLLNALDIWLSRSGEYPLTLEIKAARRGYGFLRLLVQYSGRILNLNVDRLPFPNAFFALPSGSVDLLEALDMGISDNSDELTRLLSPMSVFVQAPRLRCVTLHSWRDSIGLSLLEIPWHGLTELNITSMFSPISHYYSALQECQSLITALISVDSDDNGILECAQSDIALSQLRRLTVNADCLGSAARFLQNLSLYSVIQLSLEVRGSCSGPISLVRSLPALQQFALELIQDCALLDSNLVMWLRACSSVFDLFIDYALANSILDQIGDGTLLQSLRVISVLRADPGVLLTTLQSRRSSTVYSTITAAGAWPTRGSTNEEIESFTELLTSGIFVAREGSRSRKEIEITAQADFEGGRGFFGSPLSQLPI
ncbi:hypothetical protein B0H13DRAFT_2316663 [Mycena leptocephala]|nr:hypothetical protein B0H13DRAFT_2316663 [Mycena leptocephala]